MIVNGVELPDIDIEDADIAECYENVIEETTAAVKAVNTKSQKRSQSIREICQAIFEAFNTLFGMGTDKKVFGESVNLTVCINAYAELIDNVNELDRKAGELIKSTYNAKYNSQKLHRSKGKGKKKNYSHYKPQLVAQNPKR